MNEKVTKYNIKWKFRNVLLGFFFESEDKIVLHVGLIPIEGKFGYPSAQGFCGFKSYTFDKTYLIKCLYLDDERDYKDFLICHLYHEMFFYPDSLIKSSDGTYKINQGNHLYSLIGFSRFRYDNPNRSEKFYEKFSGKVVKCIFFEPGLAPKVICLKSTVGDFNTYIPGDLQYCSISPTFFCSDSFYYPNIPCFKYTDLYRRSISGPALLLGEDENGKIISLTDTEIKETLEALKKGSYVYPEAQE